MIEYFGPKPTQAVFTVVIYGIEAPPRWVDSIERRLRDQLELLYGSNFDLERVST